MNDCIGKHLFCFPFFFSLEERKVIRIQDLTEIMQDLRIEERTGADWMVKETEKDTQTEKETIQVQESFIKKEISGKRYISSAFPCFDTMIK